uniref:Nucleotide-diphospho-sugar transferase domain-containing protein n=1 Tax=Eutreptiella gymnastica TaxID=73025 RepID=A0A7S1HYX2_9EUGL|mmetsp:Transcript_115013/g.200126  ORF Transcript_115013/g.200126 Transcript_115013/m.200126 type:complete len:502 (+) Transcript_115013:55-1560(+)
MPLADIIFRLAVFAVCSLLLYRVLNNAVHRYTFEVERRKMAERLSVVEQVQPQPAETKHKGWEVKQQAHLKDSWFHASVGAANQMKGQQDNVVIVIEDKRVTSIALFLLSAVAHFTPSTDILICTSMEQQNEFEKFVSALGVTPATAQVFVLPFNFLVFGPTTLPAASKRFFVYQHLLHMYQNRYRKALLVDGRDVVFQGDPFRMMNDDAAYMYTERYTMRKMKSSMLTLRHCFPGDYNLHRSLWRAWSIICSGVIAGAVPHLLQLLPLQISFLVNTSEQCFHNIFGPHLQVVRHMVDQIALNVMIVKRTNCRPNQVASAQTKCRESKTDQNRTLQIRIVPPRRSPVLHMAGFSILCYDWDGPGSLRNPWGYVPSILHQYDRHPALYFYYHAYYNITNIPWRASLHNFVSVDFINQYVREERSRRDLCPMPDTRSCICGAPIPVPRLGLGNPSSDPEVGCPGLQRHHRNGQRKANPGLQGTKENLASPTPSSNRTTVMTAP